MISSVYATAIFRERYLGNIPRIQTDLFSHCKLLNAKIFNLDAEETKDFLWVLFFLKYLELCQHEIFNDRNLKEAIYVIMINISRETKPSMQGYNLYSEYSRFYSLFK